MNSAVNQSVPRVYPDKYPQQSMGHVCSNIARSPIGSWADFTADAGTHLGVCSASYWYIPDAVQDIRIAVLNDNCSGTQANNIVIKASIKIGTRYFPLTFNGLRTPTLRPHELVYSDILNVHIAGGQEVEVRLYSSADDGLTVPGMYDYVPGGAYTSDKQSTTDQTDSGTTFSHSATGHYPLKPLAIVGQFASGLQPTICVIGDSIANYNDNGADGISCFTSYVFGNAAGNPLRRILNIGFSGNHPTTLINTTPDILKLYANYPIVISAMGRNCAGGTLASFQAEMTTWWNRLKSIGAYNLYQTTITPYTQLDVNGTTDPENQLPVGGSGLDTVLKQINAWIATIPNPLSGYIDWHTAVTAENSSSRTCWKTSCASLSDGLNEGSTLLHPNSLGIQTMAYSIDLSAIGLPARLYPTPLLDLSFNGTLEDTVNKNTQEDVNSNIAYADISGGVGQYAAFVTSPSVTKINATDADGLLNNTSKFTALVWLKQETLPGAPRYIFVNSGAASNMKCALRTEVNNAITAYFGDHADTNLALKSVLPPSAGVWTLICMKGDISANPWTVSVKLYGNEWATTSTALAATTVTDHTMAFGYSVLSGTGWVHEQGRVLMVDRIMSDAEITQFYNDTKATYGIA